MKDNKIPNKDREVVSIEKLEKLLRAEKMTLAVHPEWTPFLGAFIRDYADDPARALRYFTSKAPDGSNPRAEIASLDLSNIKNEVLTAICVFLINTREKRRVDSTFGFETLSSDVPSYNQKEGRNAEILWVNRFANDLEENSRTINSVFNVYLEQEPESTSEYIDSYLEAVTTFRQSKFRIGYSHPKEWTKARTYVDKELRFLEDVLHGRKRSFRKPKINDASKKATTTIK